MESSSDNNWDAKVPSVLFSYRTGMQKCIPFDIMYGVKHDLPIESDIPTYKNSSTSLPYYFNPFDLSTRMTLHKTQLEADGSTGAKNICESQKKKKKVPTT